MFIRVQLSYEMIGKRQIRGSG